MVLRYASELKTLLHNLIVSHIIYHLTYILCLIWFINAFTGSFNFTNLLDCRVGNHHETY